MSDSAREGETGFGFDPGEQADATLAFIGHVRSDWRRGHCPKNLREARERGAGARVVLRPGYGAALEGLEVGQAIWLICWMDGAQRDLALQRPRHADGPRGTFSLRSPVRPNPISLQAVRITALDPVAGIIGIDATDAFDGTPVLDIKPWIGRVDVPPELD